MSRLGHFSARGEGSAHHRGTLLRSRDSPRLPCSTGLLLRWDPARPLPWVMPHSCSPRRPPLSLLLLGSASGNRVFQSDSSTCLYFHSGVAGRFQECLEFGGSTASHWVFQSSFLWSFLSKIVTAGWGLPCLTQTMSPLLSTGPQTVLCGFIL